MDNLFFNIYRNIYISSIITQYKFNGLEIEVSIPYLENNYKYLSKLDCQHYDINISVQLADKDQADLYMKSQHRDLISKLSMRYDINVSQQETILDELLPCNLKSLDQTQAKYSKKYPDSLQKLEIDYRFTLVKKPLEKDHLPPNLTSLWLNSYNLPLDTSVLPESLKEFNVMYDSVELFNNSVLASRDNSRKQLINVYLSILDDFTQRPVINTKQFHLKYLDITAADNSVVLEVGDIPNTVETLSISSFGELQANVIPASVTDLELHNYVFQFKVGDLPKDLKKLYSSSYNNILEVNVLPNSITEMIMQQFNQPLVANALPNQLKELKLQNFDQPLQAGVLPASLVKLFIPCFSHPITEGILPNSIETLFLKHAIPIESTQCFPSSLTLLDIDVFDGNAGFISLIPEHVKSLYIDFVHFTPAFQKMKFDLVQLPQHITSLSLGYSVYRIPSSFIPQSVRKLFIDNFETVIYPTEGQECVYPPNLQYLKLPSNYIYPLPLPKSLQTLVKGYNLESI